MKAKYRITVKDFLKANRKASRKTLQRSKKAYDRKRLGKVLQDD